MTCLRSEFIESRRLDPAVVETDQTELPPHNSCRRDAGELETTAFSRWPTPGLVIERQ
jgi:hypothetical protein